MTFYNIFSKIKKEENKPEIMVDFREKNSLVASELIRVGCKIQFANFPRGDYIVGKNIIERKTLADLENSIIDRRIFNQIKNLKENPESLLIIEGENKERSRLNEAALRGFFLWIALKAKMPWIRTSNEKETAAYLKQIALRSESGSLSIFKPKKKTLKEQVKFILESFPNIGPITSEKLIREFETLEATFNAPEERLEKILGKKAKEMRALMTCKINS
jgi:Fanconi anemia group M protein